MLDHKTIKQQKDSELHIFRVYINQHRYSRIKQPNFHSWHAILLNWASNARRRYLELCKTEKLGQQSLF